MLIVHEKVIETIDDALKYYEPGIKKLTNKFIKRECDKEDCEQELRLSIWKLFKVEDKKYNSGYVTQRLYWDTINFVNRDDGYNWYNHFVSMEELSHSDEEDVLLKTCTDTGTSLLLQYEIKDLIDKALPALSYKQLEALTLFLSGANPKMLRKFLNIKGNHLTAYYLSLAESFAILKEVSDDN
ncbi:hypothetical protein COV24_03390 [candidate division WWE3 bacterium CG10_big_fil_rev_8_21_14_0_10_32_10]|uniref:Uncharacterized protein n=1 Tax=candidate division WWE3 bacterium CG10_big_fil_rev_8_21_14_0_10_32_10 TaxID=1975090 RepID=A0A2H0RAB2_UNCKA|nr:MAG: hypothetical protein COV24_03390 [candidate division WWE3 bacterium CG10_big_fil_rev_8_21_14_0_10_32_10]